MRKPRGYDNCCQLASDGQDDLLLLHDFYKWEANKCDLIEGRAEE